MYYYNGYYYEAIGLEKLIKLYRKYVDYDLNNEPSLYAYKDLYQCCTTDPELERSEPENQSIHAPLENGVYDLMKKELKPHDPRRLIFTYIKASYDESAECPVFNSFLKQITHGNPQLEERFWMAIGYLMIYPARGKFFIVMGYARDSGKSVLGNFIQRLYPKESVGNLRLQEMKGTFSSMSFLNAVINLELDMPNAKLNAEVASRLKQITGGDSITVQRKYLSPVTLTRRIKFVFAGNYPLCIDGEDDALQKRIVFLPFNESIPDDQQDPYLEDKIWDERDAIVTKSLHYARKLVKLNYKLKARGVDVFFINDGINTATDDGELRLTIMSSMAQDESRKISERVKAGQKISREKHVLYGSGNILGYRRENGTYVPDPDQAETVRLIFQMYSTGENGLVKIVNELYRLGRLDAGGHVSWDASKVSRVLHNATYKGCICYNKSHSDGYLTQKRVKNLDESSYIYVKGDFEPLVSEEMWDRCQQILASKSTRVIDENGKKHKYMRNTPKSVWTAKLRCSCGAGFIQFKWRVNRDGAVVHGFQCYRRTRRPSISYLQEHGLDLGISCQIRAICEWKLDLMAAKVFEHLTFDKGKTVKEVYKILNRCMAEEKTVRISRKAMLENSIARQRERLDKYIDLCADGIITKQELAERRKGLDAQIAELQSQYENVEQEDERSGTIDMNLIAQKLDEWQKASRNDVNRELINSCVAQITPLTNEEYRWVLDFQLTEVQSGNSATCTLDGFMEMARFTISFEEAKAFKASRNQGIRKNEWHDLTVAVGIRTKT